MVKNVGILAMDIYFPPNCIQQVIIVLVALTVVEVANGHPALSPASGPGPASTISTPSDRILHPETFYGRHPFSRLQILAVCLIGGLALLVIALVATCIYKRTPLPPQPMPTTSLTSLPPATMAIGVPSHFHFGHFVQPSAVAEAGRQEQPVMEIEMRPREWASA